MNVSSDVIPNIEISQSLCIDFTPDVIPEVQLPLSERDVCVGLSTLKALADPALSNLGWWHNAVLWMTQRKEKKEFGVFIKHIGITFSQDFFVKHRIKKDEGTCQCVLHPLSCRV